MKTAFCLVAIGLGLSPACGGEGESVDPAIGHVGLATCDLFERCGCAFVDCGAVQADYANLFVEGTSFGLVFDPQCAESMAGWIRQTSCDLNVGTLVFAPTCDDYCSLFHGSKFAGEPCESAGGGVSDCGPGLVCHAGECKDPCAVMPPTEGQPCVFGEQPCVDGLYCLRDPEDPDDPGVCLALPGPGQPCTQSLQCSDGARCDTQNPDAPVCVALAEDGAPCTGHLQCLSGHCPDGRCRPRLVEGEACTNDLRCAEGLDCVDGTCRGSEAALCGDLTGQDQ